MSAKDSHQRLSHFGPLNIKHPKEFFGKAKEHFKAEITKAHISVVSIDEFRLLYILGKGAYSLVDLVKRKRGGDHFAVKVCSKAHLHKKKVVQNALNEKRILQSLDFPFTVRMDFFSQDPNNIYFVMPYVGGGELHTHLGKKKFFDAELTRFYAAQMVLALEYLYCIFIVHRDIKPENILVDHYGFLKLADFGLSKMVGDGRTYTFCGTPPYIAPEVVQGQGYGRSADWWSLGILIYEMAAGYPPWTSRNHSKLFLKIMYDQLRFPPSFSAELQDLLKKLLQRDVTRRFGNTFKGAEPVKEHPWFKKINWHKMLNRTSVPPFVPSHARPGSVYNFPAAAKSLTSVMKKAHAASDGVDVTTFADEFVDF